MTTMSDNSPTTNVTISNQLRNLIIAGVAIILSVAMFIGLQTQTISASLDSQAEASVPLETAFSNGKPSLIEFYANWCTSCQAMAQDLATIKQNYGKSVNFVMLNVDNSKWLPEILRYRVDGIPHFVFLNQEGSAIAQTIGEQPRTVLEADLDALIANLPLPYTYTNGQVSQFNAPVNAPSSQDDPRSHGSQVKQ